MVTGTKTKTKMSYAVQCLINESDFGSRCIVIILNSRKNAEKVAAFENEKLIANPRNTVFGEYTVARIGQKRADCWADRNECFEVWWSDDKTLAKAFGYSLDLD